MSTCAHCGADLVSGRYGRLEDSSPVCHPDNPDLPDCYRRVTVYREPLGILKALPDKPPGIENIIDGWTAWLDLLGEDIEAQATVCTVHKKFIPCRKPQDECAISVRPEDVEMVRKYQEGN